jgi:hypothetical protein
LSEDDTMSQLARNHDDVLLNIPAEPAPEPTPIPEPAAHTDDDDEPGSEPEPQAETEPTPKKRGGGPKTQAGRDRCRWNSTKDSLRSRVLTPQGLGDLSDELTEWLKAWLKPTDKLETWCLEQMAMSGARATHAHQMMVADLERIVEDAETTWDSDRYDYPKKLSFRLSKDCERIAHALNQTKEGSRVLYEAWDVLEGILQTNGTWTNVQRARAFDLLGVAPEFRDGYRRLPPDADATVTAELVRSEMDRLRNRIDELSAKDARIRDCALHCMPLEEDPAARRHRRGYAEAQRSMKQAYAMFREIRASKGEGTAAMPAPGPRPAKPKEPIPPRPYAPLAAIDSFGRRIDPADIFTFLTSRKREPESEPTPARPAETRPRPPAAAGPAAAAPRPAVQPQAAAKVPVPQAPARAVKTAAQEQKEKEDETRKLKRQREKQARKAARRRRR